MGVIKKLTSEGFTLLRREGASSMREETYSVDWVGMLDLRWTQIPSTGIWCGRLFTGRQPGSRVGLQALLLGGSRMRVCPSWDLCPRPEGGDQTRVTRTSGSDSHQLQLFRTTSHRCRKAKKRRRKIFPELWPHACPPRGMLHTHGSLESWQQAAEGQHCHPYSV